MRLFFQFALICCLSQCAFSRLRRLYGKNSNWYFQDGNPGLKLRITQHGLNQIKDAGVRILNAELRKLTVPKYTKPAGSFTIGLSNIKITRYRPPRVTSLTLKPPDSFELALRNVQLSLASGFVGTYGAIKATGSMTGSATGVSIIMQIKMRNTERGGLTAQIGNCAGSLSDASFNVEVGGLIGAFIRQNQAKISDGLKGALPGVLCDIMNTLVLHSLNSFLKEINFQVPVRLVDDSEYRRPLPSHIDFVANIQRNLTVDNRVIRPAIVTPDYIETHHVGEMLYRDDILRTPFKPRPFSDRPSGRRMISITASDYLLNSLLYHAYVRDRLSLTLSRDGMKNRAGKFLRTSCRGNSPKRLQDLNEILSNRSRQRTTRQAPTDQCIGDLIPPLAKEYPNQDAEIMIIPHGVPDFHFKKGLGVLRGSGRSMVLVTDRGRKIPVLTTNLRAISNLKLGLKTGRLVGLFITEKLQLRMHSTSLRDLSPRDVVALGPLSKKALDPQLSKGLMNGVLLPRFELLQIFKPKLTLHEGYSSFEADFIVNHSRTRRIIAKAIHEGAQQFG